MAVRECASLDILAGDTDMIVVVDKRRKGQSLSSGPVKSSTIQYGLQPLIVYFLDLRMEFHAFRKLVDLLAHFKELSFVHASS